MSEQPVEDWRAEERREVVRRVFALAEQRGLDGDDLACKLSLHPSCVGNWRRGVTGVSHRNLVKLADLFDVSVCDLDPTGIARTKQRSADRVPDVRLDRRAGRAPSIKAQRVEVFEAIRAGLTDEALESLSNLTPGTIALAVTSALDRFAVVAKQRGADVGAS